MKYPFKYYVLYIFILYVIGKGISFIWWIITSLSTAAINGGF